MVVDDEPNVLAATERILRRGLPDAEIEVFDSAITALLSLSTFRPDLIIFDIFMPGLDGLEACRRVKAQPATANIELVITSGALTEALRAQALELGARACLFKPFGPEDLLEAVGADRPHRTD